MIQLTRLNGKSITVNALLIESVEDTPDTLITLVTGKKMLVLEPVPDVVGKITAFLQAVGLVNSTIKSLNSEGS